MKSFRRIFYATDFSGASREAFSRALALAKDNSAELLIVHVLTPVSPMGPDGFVTARMYEDMETVIRRSAQKRLEALLAQARKARARARGLLLKGLPHEVIARTARAKRADLIVTGTHGRTGLARVFLGSVAARVAALATCPVLTVRGR